MPIELISGDKQIQALKPAAKRLNDGKGLYLLPFFKGGSHGWRFDYTFQSVRKTLSLGTYPAISLAEARKIASSYRTKVKLGINPSDERKARRAEEKAMAKLRTLIRKGEDVVILGSFRAAALQWHHYWRKRRSPEHVERTHSRLINHVFPHIGSKLQGRNAQRHPGASGENGEE